MKRTATKVAEVKPEEPNDDVTVYQLTVTAFQHSRDPNTGVWYKGETIYSADINPLIEKRLTKTNSAIVVRTITRRKYESEKAERDAQLKAQAEQDE